MLLAIKNHISSNLILSPNDAKMLVTSISTHSKTLTVILLYIPPNADQSYFSLLQSLISTNNLNEDLILLGDFNLPNINWGTMSGSTPQSTDFCDFLFELNLEQLISTPTHIAGNILDVILSNTTIINDIQVITPLPCGLSSDHYLIHFTFLVDHPSTVPHKVHKSVYDYSKANWDGLLLFLQSQDYTDYFNTSNVEILWSFLKHLIYQALSMFVPRITIKAHQRPKWFTSSLQHQLNQLYSMRRKYTSNPSPSNQTKLQTAEQNFQITASDSKHNYENNLINQFSTNRNSSIYKYLSFLTNYSSFPTTMHYNSFSVSTDHDQANLFNVYFFLVFTRDFSSTLNTALDSPPNSNILDNITISPHDVYDALTALDPNKAQGIDHISPKVWKISASALYYPVYHLFAKCIANSTFPAEWQTHTITPIFKSGDRSELQTHFSAVHCVQSPREASV